MRAAFPAANFHCYDALWPVNPQKFFRIRSMSACDVHAHARRVRHDIETRKKAGTTLAKKRAGCKRGHMT
jgi:hypothetical protein